VQGNALGLHIGKPGVEPQVLILDHLLLIFESLNLFPLALT